LTFTGLKCFECLSLTCDSPTICESIRASTKQKLFPRPPNLEFGPNDPCPNPSLAPQNSTQWSRLSRECTKSDSVCLEARLEVQTKFSGLKDSYRLETPFSSMTSKGILRACASRRFIKSKTGDTFAILLEGVNETLGPILLANSQSSSPVKDRYTVTGIDQHLFYVDHATTDSVQCYEDNCNVSNKPNSAVQYTQALSLEVLLLIVICNFASRTNQHLVILNAKFNHM